MHSIISVQNRTVQINFHLKPKLLLNFGFSGSLGFKSSLKPNFGATLSFGLTLVLNRVLV